MLEGEFSRQHVHIIGLGLMGGSLAMALKGHVARLTAEDQNPAVIEAALTQNVISAEGERQHADIVVLAIPVHHMPQLIGTLAETLKPGAILMDLGSTKTEVCNAFDALPDQVRAIGGHPMCGLAENSFKNAIPSLYRGARFVLCETTHTDETTRAIVLALLEAIGAVPLELDRQRHDLLTAVTSHLPHLLNFALMQLALDIEQEDADLFELAAGGFDGATRLARTNAAMITGMFGTNAINLRMLTTRLIQQLTDLNALLDDPDSLQETIHGIVQARREYSNRYGERLIS